MSQTKNVSEQTTTRNAFKDRNWEVLAVCFVFLLSLIATVAMVLVPVLDPKNTDNRFQIVPAASLMLLVELWLVASLPFYSKLTFWGAIIFLGTYLFFAVPFVFLGLLEGLIGQSVALFIGVTLVCLLLLFRQRDYYLQSAAPPQKRG